MMENGTDSDIPTRRDFHRVMSDRFGADKWLRTLKHSRIMDEASVDKLRQGAEMSMYDRMKLLQNYSPRTIFPWRNLMDKFIYFPIHSSNPGMAPSGASCGDKGNKMCHNGRCLTLEEFRKSVWDPSDDPLAVVDPKANEDSRSSSQIVKPFFLWWTLVALVSKRIMDVSRRNL